MAVREYQAYQKDMRERGIIRESARLRGRAPDKLAAALDDLNAYVINSAVAGIRMRNPAITKTQLSKEIRKVFA